MQKIFSKPSAPQSKSSSPINSDQLILQQDYELNKLIHYSPVKAMTQVNKAALIVLLKCEKFFLKRKYVAMMQLKLLQYSQSPSKVQQIL